MIVVEIIAQVNVRQQANIKGMLIKRRSIIRGLKLDHRGSLCGGRRRADAMEGKKKQTMWVGE